MPAFPSPEFSQALPTPFLLLFQLLCVPCSRDPNPAGCMAARKGRFAFTSTYEAVLYEITARLNPFNTTALKKDAWAQVRFD